MLRNLKDKLRSELNVYGAETTKEELINDSITDFVDMLEAVKNRENKKARHIIKYLVEVLKDLDEEIRL